MVEDTDVTIEEIQSEFGSEVADLVGALTDLPSFAGLQVAERKQKQADHIATTSSSVRRIKLADQISAIELDGKNTLLSKEHRIAYLKGAQKIAERCKGISKTLDELFEKTYSETMDCIMST